MRLSLHTDYALRTLLYLVGRSGRATVGQIADFYQISAHHVGKVVHQLGRRGYIRTVRGVNGGIEATGQARDLRVGDLICEMEGNLHLLECVAVDGVCTIQPNCKLRGILAEAETLQLEFLNRFTVSDLVQPDGDLFDLMPLGQATSENQAGDETC